MGQIIWILLFILVGTISLIDGIPTNVSSTASFQRTNLYTSDGTTVQSSYVKSQGLLPTTHIPVSTISPITEMDRTNTTTAPSPYVKPEDTSLLQWTEWTQSVDQFGGKVKRRSHLITKYHDCDYCFTEVTEVRRSFVNLAFNKTATASSQYKWFGAELAVDGISTTNFCNNSCMHTGLDDSPWLKIDLYDENYKNFIQEILVYNRMDCCSRRANNMTVTISDDPDGNNGSICGNRMDMNTELARFICPHPQFSRFVHIRIPGPQYLHLCEVKVLGERRVPQKLDLINSGIECSNLDSSFPKKYLIDGNFNKRFETTGNNHYKDWVKLTLHTEVSMYEIRFYISVAGSGQLTNSVVTIGNDSEMKVYGTLNAGEEIQSGSHSFYRIKCRGAQGPYIKLQKRDTAYLSIAEMEIYSV